MFKDTKSRRAFFAILLTYTLDLVGFSLAFPVLAPLLLDTSLGFFAPTATEALRTTVLGLLFAVFGMVQFIGSPLIGVAADRFGRRKVFLFTVGNSVLGYAVMAFAVYVESLPLLFLGRIWTGFSSGTFGLAQSATADLTDSANRAKAFGYLIGTGSLGFVLGPWLGGKLADPNWLHASGPFVFGCVVAIINFLSLWFFFTETFTPTEQSKRSFFEGFKDIRVVFQIGAIRSLLITFLLFVLGWGFFMLFISTFFVQKFSLHAGLIGDVWAYLALAWSLMAMWFNKELLELFSARTVVLVGTFTVALALAAVLLPTALWPFVIIIPILGFGGAMAWTTLSTVISDQSPAEFQGRAMGVTASLWSIAQVFSSLLAGPLAGINLNLPMALGALLCLFSFLYFWVVSDKNDSAPQESPMS